MLQHRPRFKHWLQGFGQTPQSKIIDSQHPSAYTQLSWTNTHWIFRIHLAKVGRTAWKTSGHQSVRGRKRRFPLKLHASVVVQAGEDGGGDLTKTLDTQEK